MGEGHREVGEAVRFAGIQDRQDVRMVEYLEKCYLAVEALGDDGGTELGPQHLYGHVTFAIVIPREEDTGHAPAPHLVLHEVAIGQRIRNADYRNMADISEFAAGRDLKQMVQRGLLEPRGEKRGRFYVAAPTLTDIARGILERNPIARTDPFAPLQPTCPGFEV